MTGACTYADSAGAMLDICYANGVKTQFNPNLGTSTNAVKKADGSACYTLESTMTSGLPVTRVDYAWKDPGGATVATGVVQVATPTMLAITCNAMTYVVDIPSGACTGTQVLPLGRASCTMGTCSF
jgi:hypothetical protein